MTTTFYASYSATVGGGLPVTASNPSVSATGSAVPADATYVGMTVSGNLTGLVGTANGLKVDGSAVTQPVSGTFWQATQPVSGTVTADQGGTWNVGTVTAVTAITNALPAGANTIGAVDQAGTWNVGVTGSVAVTGTFYQATQPVSGTFWQATQPVSLSSVPAVTTTTATFQAEGNILGSSLTSSYQSVFTPSASTKILFLRNNCNQSVTVSMDGGTTANFILDAGDQVAIDFLANALASPTTAIEAKATGTVPTSGSFRVNACN